MSKVSSSKCTGATRVSGMVQWGSTPLERLNATVYCVYVKYTVTVKRITIHTHCSFM